MSEKQKYNQEKTLVKQNEFYDVYLVSSHKLEIKEDAFKAAVEQYINNNEISGVKYTLDNINYCSYPANIEIHLKYRDIFTPDENFYSDKAFDAFCEDLAKKCGAIRVSVPYYYYSK